MHVNCFKTKQAGEKVPIPRSVLKTSIKMQILNQTRRLTAALHCARCV